MDMKDKADPQAIDGLVLMRAFLEIEDAAHRRKVIELASALARSKYPMRRRRRLCRAEAERKVSMITSTASRPRWLQIKAELSDVSEQHYSHSDR